MEDNRMDFFVEPDDSDNVPTAEQHTPAPEQQAASYEAPQPETPYYSERPYTPPQPEPGRAYTEPRPEEGYRPPVYDRPYAAYERPSYSPYAHSSEKKAEKKKGSWKLVLVIVAVALVGTLAGGFLTAAISDLRKDDRRDQNAVMQYDDKKDGPSDIEDYELTKHALPENLKSYDTGKSLNAAQVYDLTVNSVVGIQTEATMNAFGQEAVSASSGSGFILSEDGYIITNCHVVQGADKITVDLFNGDSFPAELVGADSSFDIAVLKIEAKGLPAVSVGDSDKLHVGEEVVAIGNPLGELTFTMTNGILSALDREINTDGNPQNMLQTNAAINSGNSGGPLFDMDGNVIGVTTAKYSGSTSSGTTIEGLGFAIPINDALKVAYDLVEHGYVKGQAYLGVTVRTLDSETASYYSLPIGPRVESVTAGSCAEKAGIVVGDIVLACDGVKVESNPELLAELKKHTAGETISLTIYRAGAEIEVTVTLDEKPSQEEIDAATAEQPQTQPQPQQPQQPEEDYYYEFPFPFGFDSFG